MIWKNSVILIACMVPWCIGCSVPLSFWRQCSLPAVRGLHVSDSAQLFSAEKALVCRKKTGQEESIQNSCKKTDDSVILH